MIERDHPDLSIGQQCALLSIPRSSFYYAPHGEDYNNRRPHKALGGRPPAVVY